MVPVRSARVFGEGDREGEERNEWANEPLAIPTEAAQEGREGDEVDESSRTEEMEETRSHSPPPSYSEHQVDEKDSGEGSSASTSVRASSSSTARAKDDHGLRRVREEGERVEEA